MNRGAKNSSFLFILAGLLILFGAPFLGTIDIALRDLFDSSPDNIRTHVFWSLRVPRIFAGFFIGAALSCCGVAFQALFHNPLASPFTLGVSSGAACGAAISIVSGLSLSIAGVSTQTIFALCGALATVYLVHAAGMRALGLSGVSMLLVGVIINFFFGSVVIFLQYLSDMTQLFSLMRWMMGSLEVVGVAAVLPLAVATIACTIWLAGKSRELDLVALGDELALARGLDVVQIRQKIFLVSSLLIGLTVTIAGPIGFIGIVVPHGVRLLWGPSHSLLLIRSAWLGGLLLVCCDTLGRIIMPPAEIPVGVITALVGAPAFVMILIRKRSGQIFR